MTKIVYEKGLNAQEKIAIGVNNLADLVKLTLGPKGKNIVIDRKFAPPLITNDGVTIAREFFSNDTFENIGIKLVKEVSQKTNDLAGDGTTTATVLAQKMLNEGLKLIKNGENPILINKGIEKATKFCADEIRKISKKIVSTNDIENIATISSQDKNIGKLLAKAYNKLGKNGTVLLQDSQTAETILSFQEGMKIDRGFISPYFCNNEEKNKVEFEECFLLIFDSKIDNFNRLLPLLEQILKENKPLLIVCDDIEDEALSGLVINKMRGTFNCCVIKSPFYGEKKLAVLEDLAVLCDTKVFNNSTTRKLEEILISDLGLLKQIKSTTDSTTIIPKKTNKSALELRQRLILSQIENCKVDYDKEQLKLRLSNLSGGIATISVGAQTDIEQKEKKLRIEDAISATTSAIKDGVVSGGGIIFYRLIKPLKKFIKKIKNTEEKLGAEIILNSLSEPLKQILKNANLSEDVIIIKIEKNQNQNYGFDALDNKFCDMISSGIIDPAKVSISALEMSSSVVKMMLTTEGIIAEID